MINRQPLAIVAAVLIVAAALLIVLAGGFGANRPTLQPSANPTAVETPRPTPRVTPRPSATPIDTSVLASAIVVPLRSADLTLAISGVVDGVNVLEQQTVFANQLLLTLDQSTYLAQIDVAQADVRRAQAAAQRAELQVNQLPLDATPGQIESAQAELRLAQAELDLAQTTLAEAQIALRQTELRAPFGGTVAAISVELGEQAVAGQPLVTIGDLTGWLVETTDLSELEVVRIAVGDPATLTFEALPDLALTGHVTAVQVRGTTEAGGVLFAVAVRPDVHNPDLRWNMSATVRIRPSG